MSEQSTVKKVEQANPPHSLPTPAQAVQATLVVLAMVLVFWFLWRFRFVGLTVIAAAFLHVGIKPAVEALHRRGVRRAVGVFVVYGVLLMIIVGFLLLLAPMLSAQVGNFASELPNYYRLVRNAMLTSEINLLTRMGRLLPPGSDSAALRSLLLEAISGGAAITGSPWALLGQTGEVLFFAVALLAMAFYWTMDRDIIVLQVLLRLPANRREPIRELIGQLESRIGAFIRGQLILCTVIGVLSLIAYLIIGLPYAFALAVVAFVFEAIPMVGPALTAVVAGLVAASIGPNALIWTLVAGAVIQSAENNLIVPRIMDKTVGVNPVVTLLAFTAFSLIFGILGAFLAIPLAAMIQVFIERYLLREGENVDEVVVVNADKPFAPPATTGVTGRSSVDVLHAQAMELAQDVRKQLRSAEVETTRAVAEVEDMIEQTALEVAELLANSSEEGRADGLATRAVAQEAGSQL